jgi:predicted acyl esterase
MSGKKPASEASQPIHEPKVERDVFAEMRDGTRLAVDIYRPDSGGRFPALLSMHPYCKDMEETVEVGKQLQCFNVEFAAVEAGDHEFWARRGYAHVIADVRGTGKSEGKYYNLTSPQEAQDGYDLVEWIAAQPWCDGNVGMIGISYLGFVQYFVAAQQPPHLKAIFPQDAWGDLYRDIMYHGGIPSIFGFVMDNIIPTSHPVPVSRDLYGDEEMKRRARELLDDESTSLAKNATAVKVLSLPDIHSIAFDILLNRVDGPFYRDHSAVWRMDKIEVPTYLGSEMHAYPVSMHLPGVSSGWEKISGLKKVAFRPSNQGGLHRPFYELHDEILRWYDYWLKDIDTGIMDEPPIKIWIRGREAWRYSDEWPLLSLTDWRKLYLREGGKLAFDEPSTADDLPFDQMKYEPMTPVVISTVPFGPRPSFLSYTTEPFDEDVEITGPIALYLHASLDSDDGDFVVALKDVATDGSEFVLTRGWLRASHRELDVERSQPWKPYHTHTNPTPVPHGERLEYAIEIQPIANLFRKGHRLKLEIWPCDYPQEPYDWTQYWGACHHIPYGNQVTYDVWHTEEAPAHLLMPFIRGKS